MALSKSIQSYLDVQQILDAALASGGGEYELEDIKQATRWIQRAYMFRTILQRQSVGPTKYDVISLHKRGNIVEIRCTGQSGVFRPAGPAVAALDDLDAQVAAMRRRIDE